MKITVLTLFPKMVSSFFEESIIKRAQDKGVVSIEVVNLRDFATDSYGTVDGRPYGGGAGMVLRVDILARALQKVAVQHSHIVYTSPKGSVFNQEKARGFARKDHIVIIAGHYEGIDERAMDLIDEEVSVGDFVMTGGEIAAAAIVDATVRLLPDVLKKDEATLIESFFEVSIATLLKLADDELIKKLQAQGVESVLLLEYPQYTRPEEYEGKKVPEVLLSGDHKKIEEWRIRQAYALTKEKRPDLLERTLEIRDNISSV